MKIFGRFTKGFDTTRMQHQRRIDQVGTQCLHFRWKAFQMPVQKRLIDRQQGSRPRKTNGERGEMPLQPRIDFVVEYAQYEQYEQYEQ